MKKSVILLLGIIMLAMVGCNKDKNTWGKLDQTNISIKVGETYQLTFTHDGNKFPTWASADESVATVDENGLVTGVGVGETEVSVNGLICKVKVGDDLEGAFVMPDLEFSDNFEAVDKYMSKNVGLSLDIAIDTLMAIDSVDNGTEMVYDTVYYVGRATYLYMGLSDVINEYVYEFTKDGNIYAAGISMDKQENRDTVKQYIENRYEKVTGENYTYTDGTFYIFEAGLGYVFTKDKNYNIN